MQRTRRFRRLTKFVREVLAGCEDAGLPPPTLWKMRANKKKNYVTSWVHWEENNGGPFDLNMLLASSDEQVEAFLELPRTGEVTGHDKRAVRRVIRMACEGVRALY